jgi:hypothetical protein
MGLPTSIIYINSLGLSVTVTPDGQWPRTVKVVEMKGTDGSFVPIRFSRIGTERLKN